MSPPKDPEKRKIYCENARKRSKKLWEDAELEKKMNSTLQQYKNIMITLMLLNIWDFHDLPKSLIFTTGFIFLMLKVI